MPAGRRHTPRLAKKRGASSQCRIAKYYYVIAAMLALTVLVMQLIILFEIQLTTISESNGVIIS